MGKGEYNHRLLIDLNEECDFVKKNQRIIEESFKQTLGLRTSFLTSFIIPITVSIFSLSYAIWILLLETGIYLMLLKILTDISLNKISQLEFEFKTNRYDELMVDEAQKR